MAWDVRDGYNIPHLTYPSKMQEQNHTSNPETTMLGWSLELLRRGALNWTQLPGKACIWWLKGPAQGDSKVTRIWTPHPKCTLPFLKQRARWRSDPKYFQISGREDEEVRMKVQSSVKSTALWSHLKTPSTKDTVYQRKEMGMRWPPSMSEHSNYKQVL